MELGVREVSQLMNVSETTVHRWIRNNEMPSHKVNGQHRFNRSELLEWATTRRIRISGDIFAESHMKGAVPTLPDALRSGGIHRGVPGRDKAAALRNAVEAMPLPPDADREFLFRVLLAREDLGTTAVGNGIAIPHVRNPIVMDIAGPMISLCFLEMAIEFDAPDGNPVNTLFTLVSPTVSAHLILLSRLAHGLHQPEFLDVIARRGPSDEILRAAAAVEDAIALPTVGPERTH